MGRKHRHPDFIIIDPSQGLIFLEVKDWKLTTLRQVNPEHVILETEDGTKCEINPIEQVTRYSRDIINLLSQDPRLQQSGAYQGKLKIAWAYGVIFTNITRKQLESLSTDGSINTLFPPRLTLCQDEIAESVSSDSFRKKLPGCLLLHSGHLFAFKHAILFVNIFSLRWLFAPEKLKVTY